MQTEIIKNDESKKSYALKITPRKGRKQKESFVIPVIDVRDGQAAREAAKLLLRGNQKPSKYVREKFSWFGRSYQVSPKQFTKFE